VAVDAAGNAYITGVTTSPNFPVTGGAVQRSSASAGIEDAFVVKITPVGGIAFSSYLGGSGSDIGFAIAVDQNGAAYVAGSTGSTNFPVTGSAAQRVFGGSSDCFVAKLDPTGASLAYATYLGGAAIDICKGIALDSTGAAFVTGTTLSGAFPILNALKTTLAGASDAFLTKISPSGDRLVFSTYLGGNGADNGNVVRIDSAGVVYLAGDTGSTGFPVTSEAAQGQFRGEYDGFVCMVANDGSQILYASYLGGSGADSITDLSLGQEGRILVTGFTTSADFLTVQAIQNSQGGSFDGFVAVLGSGGRVVDFASYLGGGGDDRGLGIAPLGNGQLVVAGQMLAGTLSSVPNRFSFSPGGQYDGFVAAMHYGQPLQFIPVTPCRVADTRNPSGAFGGPSITGGTSRDFVIPSSGCGIPSTAQAYSVNVTAVPSGALGFLTLWPSGQPKPLASTLNSDGRVKSNAAIVPAGQAGAITVFAGDTTNVILDVNGYFVPAGQTGALAFYPVSPCRVLDTRNSTGVLGGPSLSSGATRTLPIRTASACNIPAQAAAYSLNLAAVPSGPLGFLTVWPSGQARPLASSLNASTGSVTANASIVQAGSNGSIDVFASSATGLVIDINGYFAPPASGGLTLYSVSPCRVLDTRQPPGSAAPSGARDFQVSAAGCGIPSSAPALVLGLTVVPAGSLGYLAVWAQGLMQPVVSSVNAPDGAITSNMAIVPATNGWVSSFLANPSHMVIDVSAYFAP
jgi:hypothetical protein